MQHMMVKSTKLSGKIKVKTQERFKQGTQSIVGKTININKEIGIAPVQGSFATVTQHFTSQNYRVRCLSQTLCVMNFLLKDA